MNKVAGRTTTTGDIDYVKHQSAERELTNKWAGGSQWQGDLNNTRVNGR